MAISAHPSAILRCPLRSEVVATAVGWDGPTCSVTKGSLTPPAELGRDNPADEGDEELLALRVVGDR